MGCEQWWPARTAIPASFSSFSHFLAVEPVEDKGENTCLFFGVPDEFQPGHLTGGAPCVLQKSPFIGENGIQPMRVT
jgi:hypothetical protein